MTDVTLGKRVKGGSASRLHKKVWMGARRVVRRPDENVLARKGEWLLVSVDGWSAGEWKSLKLYHNKRCPKNVYYLSSNGDRLAVNRDAARLSEHHPEIRDWVMGATCHG